MEFPKRKPNRLSNFDYSSPGAYFITICTQNKVKSLAEIVGGGALDAPFPELTETGKIVEQRILSGNQIPGVYVDKYVIMPNHIHMIVLVDQTAGKENHTDANAVIPHFISTLKRFCHRDSGKTIFQRSYHDHVIRDERDYRKIWQYIDTNPARWAEDCFYQA